VDKDSARGPFYWPRRQHHSCRIRSWRRNLRSANALDSTRNRAEVWTSHAPWKATSRQRFMARKTTCGVRGSDSILESKVGRLICNGFPTGVEVFPCHGARWTLPRHVRRALDVGGQSGDFPFARPVCYQGFPKVSCRQSKMRIRSPFGAQWMESSPGTVPQSVKEENKRAHDQAGFADCRPLL